MNKERLKTIAYWVTTVLGPTSFVIGGYIHLMRTDHVLEVLSHLGYPAYFATFLGIGKLLGAIVLTVPRLPLLKEWAYAGFSILLTCAFASHVFVGDPMSRAIQPLVFLALVMASWALRPASRRLR